MPAPVFYSISPFGTGTIETGAGITTTGSVSAGVTVHGSTPTGTEDLGLCIRAGSSVSALVFDLPLEIVI